MVQLTLFASMSSIIIIKFTGNADWYFSDLTVWDKNNIYLVYSVLCVCVAVVIVIVVVVIVIIILAATDAVDVDDDHGFRHHHNYHRCHCCRHCYISF